MFVKEIEEALLAGRIDVAVHSAKDMTSTDTAGLAVAAYLERDDPRDALVGAAAIVPGMRIGTACARRRAQLLAHDATLAIESLRGNVETRLRKMRERGLDAIILASCGLDRLGLSGEIGLRLEPELMLPEAAQGALALQVRAGEEVLAAHADHAETRRRVELERRCVASIGGRLPRPRRRAPRRHDPARTDRRRRRCLGRARGRRRSRAARRAAARRARSPPRRRMKVVVTRPRAQAQPLVDATRGAGSRGRRVPADRDRAHVRRADRRRGLRLGRSSRARTAPTSSHGVHPRLPQIAAVGPGTAEALRAHGDRAGVRAAPSRRRKACCASFPGRRAGCSSRLRKARGARPIDGARRRLRRRSTERGSSHAAAAGRRLRAARVRLRRARVRGYRRRRCPRSRSARRRRASRERPA